MKKKFIFLIIALIVVALVISLSINFDITGEAVANGLKGYCQTYKLCNAGEGDCEQNSECSTKYCHFNVGDKYGFGKSIDVCEEREDYPYLTEGCAYLGESVKLKIIELQESEKKVILKEKNRIDDGDYFIVGGSKDGDILKAHINKVKTMKSKVTILDVLNNDKTLFSEILTSNNQRTLHIGDREFEMTFHRNDYDGYIVIDFPQTKGDWRLNFEGCLS